MGIWDGSLEKLRKEGILPITEKHFIDRKITSHDLSTGALNYTTDISDKFRVHQVLICSRDGAGDLLGLADTTITIYFNSSDGTLYDTPIGQADFDSESSMGLIAGDRLLGVTGEADDEITVVSTGTDAVGILYVTTIFSILT